LTDVVGVRQSNLKSKQGKGTNLIPVLPVRDAVHFPHLINTLHVVREASLRALRRSMDADRRVLVISQRDMSLEDPQTSDLFRVGTLSETLQAVPMPDASVRVALRGLSRVRATKIISRAGAFWAEIEEITEIRASSLEAEALMRAAVDDFGRVVAMSKSIPPESMQTVAHLDEAGHLADAIAHHLPIRFNQKQELLEIADAGERLDRVLELIKREEQVLTLNADIHRRVERELGETQRDYYLREQLRIIQEELQVREDRLGEHDEYVAKLEQCNLPPDAMAKAQAELKRLDRTPAASPEGMVLRNYLDTIVALPWNEITDDRLDVRHAAELLDEEHFGLASVKERVLDHLAVRQLKSDLRGPILCFVGPPGVGKTSIGRAIAEAMGRKFVRLSLGGVRDEAEIRGHRRTYVGSMPGRIIQSLRQCGTRNPVFMLDEIDKIGGDYRGDPTSALLEVLDPEQNSHFSDHYIEAPFDLSAVFFIATANVLANILSPLRDRMEVIQFSSYTDAERLQIARQFLLPKALRQHGLSESQIHVSDDALERIAGQYAREAGMRELERQITGLVRKCARRVAEHGTEHISLTASDLGDLIGRPKYAAKSKTESAVGAATGLVVSEAGGDTIVIEASLMKPSGNRPEMKLTGSMGQVMQESAEAALTYIRSHQGALSPTEFRYDVHVHIPEAAIPKDGPSGGVTIAVALASAFTGKVVRTGIAMSGEITLRGRVMAVGGIREKVLAAHRAGIMELILPADNEPDLDDLPGEVRSQMRVHLVSDLAVALEIALGPSSNVAQALVEV
jgi:ATP-dependent Lon protease